MLTLICLLSAGAVTRMPIDIFPEINIPVVSVVWTYAGMSPQDIQNRILTLHERQLASLVDDISRIEATSCEGVGVEKVYLHEGADVSRAVSQLASSALVVLKYMPTNITPALVLRYGATDVQHGSKLKLAAFSDALPPSEHSGLPRLPAEAGHLVSRRVRDCGDLVARLSKKDCQAPRPNSWPPDCLPSSLPIPQRCEGLRSVLAAMIVRTASR
jgi:hypothetical protein